MKSWNAAARERAGLFTEPASGMTWRDYSLQIERIESALAAADLTTRPIVVVDLDAFDANIQALRKRAHGMPIRVASKSIRVRELIARAVAACDGGILAYSVREALHLIDHGFRDIVVAYPCVDHHVLAELASNEVARENVTVMVDSVAHGNLIVDAVRGILSTGESIRVALELDVSFRPMAKIHVGALRSPIFSAEQARDLAIRLNRMPHLRLVGVMGYEGQIAGTGNAGMHPMRVATRVIQSLSARELNARRASVVDAIQDVCPLEFVNGGGTGSIESSCLDPTLTDVAAGSGFMGPALFDQFHHFSPEAALFLGFSVVRRPRPAVATLFGGGWIASGPFGADRSPMPVHPAGLKLASLEGAGEVQTPVVGRAAEDLRLGDTVWMRHAKAGEPAEHVDSYVLVRGSAVEDVVPTYRGDNRTFQ